MDEESRRNRMDQTYKVRWPRWNSVIWCLVGIALLYIVIDVHFVGFIPGATSTMRESIAPTALLGSFGLLCLMMGGSALIRPPLLLEAESSGIWVYNRVLGDKRAVVARKRLGHNGAICCIPWGKVSAIAAGTAYWSGFHDAGPTVEESKALLIACDSSIRLDEYRWVGDVMVGLGPAVTAEGKMWPGSRIRGHEQEPHLIINAKYLSHALDETVKRLSEMKVRGA